jgi:hypothetical protein
MKRKNHHSLDIKPINLQLSKYSLKFNSVFDIHKLQPFFPPIEQLFKTEILDNPVNYGIKFNSSIQSITNNILKNSLGEEFNVHPKITMLLNPYKYMKGELQSIELPLLNSQSQKSQSKLQNYNNAAYVGSILSSVLSLSGCHHFPKVFGVFSGISNEFKLDISDDYEELSERPWFSKNIGKTFTLNFKDGYSSNLNLTKSSKNVLKFLDEEIILDDFEEIKISELSEPILKSEEFKPIFNDESIEVKDDDTSSSISTSYIFDIDSISTFSDDDLEEDEDDEDSEDDESFVWALFKNVPVQLTIMEKLDGTLYDLFTTYPDPQKHYVWLIQVIFALAYAQRNFGFIHNDLHGNNIMFQSTTKEYFYYMHNSIKYKIPTYGYLIKIIDFDRGIGYVKLPTMKEPRLFMSDQFAAEEEAGGQYNCEPFYKDKYPIIKPNYSFDLVRLATSLFWDLFPMGPKYDSYQDQKLFKMFMRWLTLPDNTNVLFHKQNPKLDRYYGFDLYKAIARFSKDTAIPKKEIPMFTEFIVLDIPSNEHILIIDV